MTTPRVRLGRIVAALLALPVAFATDGSAGAAAPPTLPPGSVELIDDTGTITVVVPDTWTEVDTAPALDVDGALQPWISASPDYAQFQETFDVPGVVYRALPYQDDLQALVDEFGLPDGACSELAVTPYDDTVFVGLAQLGTSCGEAGTSSWAMVAANPVDNAFTALVQVQTATAADDEAVATVLQSFNVTTPTAGSNSTVDAATVPAASGPGVSVPAGLGPVEVATTFLDALAGGDGATACALLTAEEMTINFVEEAETCALDLSLQVLGQGEFWATVQIAGDESTSSDTCGDEDPTDDFVSLELQGPTDDGCLSISIDDGEWRIEDLSNSIWNQAS